VLERKKTLGDIKRSPKNDHLQHSSS